jgi:hypothetical protein
MTLMLIVLKGLCVAAVAAAAVGRAALRDLRRELKHAVDSLAAEVEPSMAAPRLSRSPLFRVYSGSIFHAKPRG